MTDPSRQPRILAGYMARYCPRYSASQFRKRSEEHLRIQRSLWGAAQLQQVGRLGLAVELRAVSERIGRRSHLIILVREPDAGANPKSAPNVSTSLLLAGVERILPAEYGWVHLGNDCASQLVPAGSDERTPWKISRVIRQMEFVALPGLALGAQLAGLSAIMAPQQALGRSSSTSPSPNAPSGLDTPVHAVDGLPEEMRNLPRDDSRTVLRDIRIENLCLPISGALTDDSPKARRFWQEFQAAGPAIMSIMIHPIDHQLLAPDGKVAAGWKRFLQPFASEVGIAGFSDYSRLRAAYDRYVLPNRYLCYVSMRIAATDAAAAIGLAQHLAALLGGMRAFDVLPPSADKTVSSAEVNNPYLDIPSTGLPVAQLANLRGLLGKQLKEQRVKDPNNQEYIDFLLRMPHIYTVEEVEQILRLPIADDEGLAGLETRMVPPFFAPTLKDRPAIDESGQLSAAPSDEIRIGLVRTSPVLTPAVAQAGGIIAVDAHWHTIHKDDLTKHAFVVGSTGSGKTMTTLFLAREIARLRPRVPFLVLEPVKTEYYDRLRAHIPHLRKWHLDSLSEGFLAFDPMRLQEGVSVARHASYLKSCFEAAFPMEPWQALVLESGLREYYTDLPAYGGCGFSLFTIGSHGIHQRRDEDGGVFPSLRTFERFFCGRANSFVDRAFPSDGGSAGSDFAREQKVQFQRRFKNLVGGLIGMASEEADTQFKAGIYEPFSQAIGRDESLIIELDAVPDPEQKALIMAFLMTFLFERRQADDATGRKNGEKPSGSLKHVLILEEAHRILENTTNSRASHVVGQSSKAKAVSLFVDMLAEIRAFGQGIMIVEQIPTKIVTEAVKNTNLKIMLRLTSRDDRSYLGESMSFTSEQKRFVAGLRANPGEEIQFVAFEEGVDQPLLLGLPFASKDRLREGWLFDEHFSLHQ